MILRVAFVLASFAAFFSAMSAQASQLSVDFQSKDVSLKGEFDFKPGQPLKINSLDTLGQPYEFEVTSSLHEERVFKIAYKLIRNGQTQTGFITTSTNELAKVSTGLVDQQPFTSFEVKVSE